MSAPLIQRIDVALWRLPRPARKAVVGIVALPVLVAAAADEGAHEAWDTFRGGWRTCMDHVQERPQQEER